MADVKLYKNSEGIDCYKLKHPDFGIVYFQQRFMTRRQQEMLIQLAKVQKAVNEEPDDQQLGKIIRNLINNNEQK